MVNIDYEKYEDFVEGFRIDELRQIGGARMHDVRQADFRVHRLAHTLS